MKAQKNFAKSIEFLKFNTLKRTTFFLFFVILTLLKGYSQAPISNVVSIDGSCSPVVSLQNPHPTGLQDLSSCYDRFQLKFSIKNLEPSTSLNYLTLELPLDVTVLSTDANPNVNSNPSWPIDVTITNNTVVLNYINSSLNPPKYNGDWTIEFQINSCALYNASSFPIKMNLVLNSLLQTLAFESRTPLFGQVVPPNKVDMSLNIERPKITLERVNIPPAINSKFEEYFNRYDIVERYYMIKPAEGISDYFSLEMTVEDDIDILAIDAVNLNGVLINTIHNVDVIPGGSKYTMVFYNPASSLITGTDPTSLLDLSTNNYTSDQIVGVPFSNVLPPGPFINGLFIDKNDVNNSNYILIRETVKIKKVINCNGFLNSATQYEVKQFCDDNYLSAITCPSSSTFSLDVRCERDISVLSIVPSVLNGATYEAIGANNKLNVCGTKRNWNFTALIENNYATTPIGKLDPAATIMKLNKVELEINDDYFDYDLTQVQFGSIIIPQTAITTNQSGERITIDFNDQSFSTLLQQTSPSINQNDYPIYNQLNAQYPVPSDRKYVYLPVNSKIGITFPDLKLKPCSALADLIDCNSNYFFFTNNYKIDYQTVCEMDESAPSIITSNDVTYKWNTNNASFGGYTYATAKPINLTPNEPTSILTFSHINTGVLGTSKFSALENNSVPVVEMLDCANRKYQIIVTLPSGGNGNATYSINNYEIRSSTTGTLYPSTFSPNGNQWIFEWTKNNPLDPLDPHVSLIVEILINCPALPSIDFGFDTFKAEFRDVCDPNCQDCYINYGCTEVDVYKHCLGPCYGARVSTKNFELRRNSFGWASQSDFQTNQPPLNSTNARELEKVYPCDEVYLKSTDGFVGYQSAVGMPVLAVSDIDELYYEIRFKKDKFPNNYQLTSSFLELNQNKSSNFIITPTALLPCQNGQIQSYNVSISPSDITLVDGISVNEPLYYIIRINANLTATPISITGCSITSVKQLIQATTCSLAIEANFIIRDLYDASTFQEGVYYLNSMLGQFACTYGTGPNYFYSTSCDPYVQNLTYLQTRITSETQILSNNNVAYDQCRIALRNIINVFGGLPNADDFLTEFRPILNYPSTVEIGTSADINFDKAYLIDRSYQPPQNYFNFTGSSTANGVNIGLNGQYPLVFEKGGISQWESYWEFIRNCADDNDIQPIFDVLNFSPTTTCGTITSSSLTPFNYNNPIDSYNIDVSFSPNNLTTLKVPTDKIELEIVYKNHTGNLSTTLPNAYIYFTSSQQIQNYSYNLVDGQGLTISSILDGQGNKVFKLDNLDAFKKKLVYLQVNWTSCDKSLPIIIEAHVGAICTGYAVIPTTQFPSCQEFVFNYTIEREESIISSASFVQNPNVFGCSEFSFDVELQSQGGDPLTALFVLTLPNYLDLITTSCKVALPNGTSTGITINQINPTQYTVLISDAINAINTYIGGPPLVGLNFFKGSQFERLILHLVMKPNGLNTYPPSNFTVNYRFFGINTCGNDISEQVKSVNFFYWLPPLTCTLNGPDSICDGSYVALSTTCTPNQGLTYHWSNGSTTPTINASKSGLYSVTITDIDGCSLTLSRQVAPSLTVAINASPTSIICPGLQGNPITLSTTVTSSTAVSYLWSTGATSPSIVVSNINSNAVYTVTVTNSVCRLETSQSITLNNNCCNQFGADLKQTDFDNYNTILAGSYNLNVDVEIKSNSSISFQPGVYVAIAPNVTIRVRAGGTLNIENGVHLFACFNEMWNGIVAEPGSTVIIRSGLGFALIEHAKIALDASMALGQGLSTTILVGDRTTFNENNVGIYLHDGEFSNAIIENCLFKCDNQLRYPFSTNAFDQYSTNHIWLRDAGTLSMLSGKYTTINCTFMDAKRGVFVERTHLKINNCVFYRGQYKMKDDVGIYANGFLEEQATNRYYTIDIGTPSIPSSFSNFNQNTKGVLVMNNYQVNISSNNFYQGDVNIFIRGCNEHLIRVFDNKLEKFSRQGIQLQDNSMANIQILQNKLNVGIPFQAAIEARKGIYINNSSLTLNNANIDRYLLVRDNVIANCRFGIQLMNQRGGFIESNAIRFNILDGEIVSPSNFIRKGIVTQGSQNLDVRQNEVTRACNACGLDAATMAYSDGPDYMIGYSLENSEVRLIDNSTLNLPVASRLYGNLSTSKLECNNFTDCLIGFKVVNTQIQSVGSATHPSGNQWTSLIGQWNSPIPGSKITGPLTPNKIDWYYKASTLDYEASPFNGNVIADFPNTPGLNCTSSNCLSCRVKEIYDLINDSNFYYLNPNSNAYINLGNFDGGDYSYQNRQLAYQFLKDSLQLLSSGSVYDASLQNFFTATSLSNIGMLYNVNELLNSNETATAYLLNSTISTTELKIYNSVKVNTITSNYYQDSIVYSPEQRLELLSIAYQYPHVGGEAVYRARAILNLDLDDTQISYRYADSNSLKQELYIYPNPNNGQFNLNYLVSKDEAATVYITDAIGKLIVSQKLINSEQLHQFNLSGVNSGMYYLKLVSSFGTSKFGKINVLK
jgi:hypothetical protein